MSNPPPDTPPPSDNEPAAPSSVTPARRRRRWAWLSGVLIALLLAIGLPPLLSWQRVEHQRIVSLNNLRRLSTGFLLYAQDWDGCPMPIAKRQPDGHWLTWTETIRPYLSPSSVFVNPANPVSPSGPKVTHPTEGYPVPTSYALNRRLWDTFSPGPFPLDNLELPGQTALFVEAGPMWSHPRHASKLSPFALLDYGDTTDRVQGFSPYPSSHDGRMATVAADGHTVMVKVEHYSAQDGAHDPLYGRIGGSLHNWNGGYLNGQTDRPPRE